MANRLMIIGSLIENVELVKRAKARNYYTVVCDGYKEGPAKALADKAYDVDINDVDRIVDICKYEKIDGIMGSFSDLIFEKITEIADKARLKWYISPDQLKYYRDKDQTKLLLESLGIKVPKHRTLSDGFSDAEVDGFSFPLVIKPVDQWGSKGVFVANDISELRKLFNVVKGFSKRDHIEIEEYSRGREYNMMTWLVDGHIYVMSIADREKNPQMGNKIPLINRVVYPSKNIRFVIDEATEILNKFAKRTGQTDGILSMQFFSDENGIEVCEIAGRMFGYEHDLITKCSGLDIESLMLDYLYDPDAHKRALINHSPFYNLNCAALVFFGIDGKVIKDQTCLERIGRISQVYSIWPFYKEGETVDNKNVSHFARICIAADNRREIDRVTKEIFNSIDAKDINGEDVCYRAIMMED